MTIARFGQKHTDEFALAHGEQEFCWRYNRRGMQPFMFNTLLTEVATKKPLTYKTLTRDVF
jgi:hypothetical protein